MEVSALRAVEAALANAAPPAVRPPLAPLRKAVQACQGLGLAVAEAAAALAELEKAPARAAGRRAASQYVQRCEWTSGLNDFGGISSCIQLGLIL